MKYYQKKQLVNLVESVTRTGAINFHVGNVTKPLASTLRVVKAGNRIVLGRGADDNYIENLKFGDRMKLRDERGVYVYNEVYDETGR